MTPETKNELKKKLADKLNMHVLELASELRDVLEIDRFPLMPMRHIEAAAAGEAVWLNADGTVSFSQGLGSLREPMETSKFAKELPLKPLISLAAALDYARPKMLGYAANLEAEANAYLKD